MLINATISCDNMLTSKEHLLLYLDKALLHTMDGWMDGWMINFDNSFWNSNAYISMF